MEIVIAVLLIFHVLLQVLEASRGNRILEYWEQDDMRRQNADYRAREEHEANMKLFDAEIRKRDAEAKAIEQSFEDIKTTLAKK